MNDFLMVRCQLPAACEDDLPEVLKGLPVLGCEISGGAEQEIGAAIYLSAKHTHVSVEIRERLLSSGATDLEIEKIALKDWIAAYREQAAPFAVGHLWWMDPHPKEPTPAPQGRIRLAVEPRMAFGTGSHESTQLVLLELEELVVRQKTVLDVGTGSGVLALAADALGAALVVGLDIDPLAIWVARKNLDVQDWQARPLLVSGPVRSIANRRFDLVLCNMIPDHFLPLLGDLGRLVESSGEIVFSGILSCQQEAVTKDLWAAGLQVTGERLCNEWLCLRAGFCGQ
jgi:ribosomal protein L11 methyltransferase